MKETVGGGVNLPRILRTLSKYISPDAIFSFSPAQVIYVLQERSDVRRNERDERGE